MTSITSFKVSPTGYFVYHNGETGHEGNDAKLEFDIKLVPEVDTANENWIDSVLADIKSCLMNNKPIVLTLACEKCNHRKVMR